MPFSNVLNLVAALYPIAGRLEALHLSVLSCIASLADAETKISGYPFVFSTNLELGKALDMRPRQVVRALERLEAEGLVTIQGDRHAHRRREAAIEQSPCIDLRVLVARYEELRP